MALPMNYDAIKQAINKNWICLWGPAIKCSLLFTAIVLVNVSDFLALANIVPSHTMHVGRPYLVSSCCFRSLLKYEDTHPDEEANQQCVPEFLPGIDLPIFEEEPLAHPTATEETTDDIGEAVVLEPVLVETNVEGKV